MAKASSYISIDQKLLSIGIQISSETVSKHQAEKVDIEEALLGAAKLIATGEDSRILSLILSWISVHGEMINMERLKKLRDASHGVDASWINLFAFFGLSQGQSRWRLLAKPIEGLRSSGPMVQTKIRAEYSGEEHWSQNTGFLIPKGSEPISNRHILPAEALAKLNHQYRNRLIFGPCWRADIVTAIENGARSPAEIVKRTGASYEPAHRVFHDLKLAGKIPRIAG